MRITIGFLSETPAYLHVRVGKLLMYAATMKVRGNPEQEVRMAVRPVGLRKLLDRRADKLSAGYRQRLALGLAMLGEPELLILDEPAANLDPKARVELYALIKNLRKDYSVNVLISAHTS